METNLLKDFDSVINCPNSPIDVDCACLSIKTELGAVLLSKAGTTRNCRTGWELVRQGGRQKSRIEKFLGRDVEEQCGPFVLRESTFSSS